MASTAANPCIAAGYPCFTPNSKDVGASSLVHTCGPVGDLFSCQDLGPQCAYDFSLYVCNFVKCPGGSFDSCNVICLADDASYQDACTASCTRACGAGPPSPPAPPPSPTPPTPPPPPPIPPPTPGCTNKLYDQCGGNDWKGPFCCPPGSKCVPSPWAWPNTTATQINPRPKPSHTFAQSRPAAIQVHR